MTIDICDEQTNIMNKMRAKPVIKDFEEGIKEIISIDRKKQATKYPKSRVSGGNR